MTPWPHQTQAVADWLAALSRGARRPLLQSPTGGGKSLIMAMMVRQFMSEKTSLYTNRKMLIEQLSDSFVRYSIPHGIRAAGHEDQRELPIQISSIQTEHARVVKREEYRRWQLHDAAKVLVDEAHLHTGPTARKLLDLHEAAGAILTLVTATPFDMEGMADCLIQAGSMSELRACGALVAAYHYGCGEPDFRKVKKPLSAELSENEIRKLIDAKAIWGHVLANYHRINPEQKPTLLFAPGVDESHWFAETFTKCGVPAAHIDGEDIWINGSFEKSTRTLREEVIAMLRAGSIKVLCNRYVLREGIDLPFVEHGIFATVFGSLQSYIQSSGRLLRASPKTGKTCATIQDHGGNWWKWGSVNADRVWRLDLTANAAASLREHKLRTKAEREPMCCPACGMILMGQVCRCGHVMDPVRRPRQVYQIDGSLIEHTGDIFKPLRVKQTTNTQKLWERMYYRAKNSKNGMTFAQADALFAMEHYYHPPRTLRLMPKDEYDWYRRVRDVPFEGLI